MRIKPITPTMSKLSIKLQKKKMEHNLSRLYDLAQSEAFDDVPLQGIRVFQRQVMECLTELRNTKADYTNLKAWHSKWEDSILQSARNTFGFRL